MVSNYKVQGTDLNSIFDLNVDANSIASSYKINAGTTYTHFNAATTTDGDAITSYYCHIPPSTGYKVSGTDIGGALSASVTGSNVSGAAGTGTAYRANIANQYTTTTSGTKLTSQRTTSWTNSIVHELTVTFSSTTHRDQFFVYGGMIIFSGNRSGGAANNQNTDWTNLLSSINNVYFRYGDTYQAAAFGTGSSIGGSTASAGGLTTSYVTVYSAAGTAPYAGDTYTLEAKVDAGGTVLSFRATLVDASDGTVDTAVDGTLNHNVDERRYTGSPNLLTIASPTFATVTALTAGT